MFRHLIICTLLLSLKPALGSQDETVPELDALSIRQILYILRQLYPNFTEPDILDDDVLNKILEHTRIRSRSIAKKTEISHKTNNRLTEILDEINNRLKEAANEINRLADQTNQIANEINKKLRANNCANSDNAKRKKAEYPTSCLQSTGGLQEIKIDRFSLDPFFVYCDNVTHGGGWTVIQRRMDGSVDFYRSWAHYKQGFGNLTGEFFIGLDKLYALTTTSAHELLIVMRDKDGVERFAKYEAFAISGEDEHYALNVGGEYSGDARNDLTSVRSGRLRTKDHEGPNKCFEEFLGAWWQIERQCDASLNGNYGDDREWKGINWHKWRGYKYSLLYVQMMIRPKSR